MKKTIFTSIILLTAFIAQAQLPKDKILGCYAIVTSNDVYGEVLKKYEMYLKLHRDNTFELYDDFYPEKALYDGYHNGKYAIEGNTIKLQADLMPDIILNVTKTDGIYHLQSSADTKMAALTPVNCQ